MPPTCYELSRPDPQMRRSLLPVNLPQQARYVEDDPAAASVSPAPPEDTDIRYPRSRPTVQDFPLPLSTELSRDARVCLTSGRLQCQG